MYSCFFFGIFSIQVTLARVGLATCTEANCPEGYFCHEKICKKCLRCDVLFRKGNFCVIDFNECKECLEGFEEILITDYSNVIKPCKPVKKKVKLKMCENDNSCPQNNYCNEESCIKCFDCSLLNRLPPVKKCAKGLNECGSCMIGFNEVSVTTEANYKPCERNIALVPEIPDPYEISFVTIVLLCAISAALVAIGFILVFKKYKDPNSVKTLYKRPPSLYPSAPPFYSMETPQPVRKVETVEPTVSEYIIEKKQQAKVFKKPDALYYFTEEETNLRDNTSQENNDRSRPNSFAPSNSGQSEEINCSTTLLNEESELALNEYRVASLAEQPNDNTVEEIDSPSTNSIAFGLSEVSTISENPSDQETDNLTQSQNLNQEQT